MYKKNNFFLKTILSLTFSVLSILCISSSAYAAGGGWIGNGNATPPGGGTYPGSGAADCSTTGTLSPGLWAIDCGVSWIFYKAKTTTESDISFPNYPRSDISPAGGNIPAECSKHIDKNGGFYHFGVNSLGWNGFGNGYGGFYGHWLTLNSGFSYQPIYAPVYPLNQDVGGVYEAKYNMSWAEALNAYRDAYAHSVGKKVSELGSDTPTAIPGGVWGFCWWEGMGNGPEPSFEGIASASNADFNITTDWKSEDDSKSHTLLCTDETNGCSFSYSLGIRRKDASVTESSNYIMTKTTSGGGASATETIETGAYNATKTENYIKTDNDRIKPNQTICYKINFNATTTKQANEEVCITATKNPGGNPDDEPDDPEYNGCRTVKGSELLKMSIGKSRNAWVDNDEIYVKPGDTVYYCADYNPMLYQGEYGYNFRNYDCLGNCTNFLKPLGSALGMGNYLDVKRSKGNKNQVATFGGSSISGYPLNHRGGNTTPLSDIHTYNVTSSDVGYDIAERSNTLNNTVSSTVKNITPGNENNFNKNDGECPYNEHQCGTGRDVPDRIDYSCPLYRDEDDEDDDCGDDYDYVCKGYDGEYYYCTVKEETKSCWDHRTVAHSDSLTAEPRESNEVHAYVPYNFINEPETNLIDGNGNSTTKRLGGIVYAGGVERIGYVVNTRPKYNSLTGGTYATRVDNAQIKIEVYSSDYPPEDSRNNERLGQSWGTIEVRGGVTFNGNNDPNGDTYGGNDTFQISIPDVPAGSYVCAKTLVYPASSGADDNWQDPNGDYSWTQTQNKVCFLVAKKPSIQAWGSSAYSNTNINTSVTEKYHVKGKNEYHVSSADYNGDTSLFGSWSELGVIGNGKITGFASGASLGGPWGESRGSKDNDCTRVPLSFANAIIRNGTVTCRTDAGNSIGELSKVSNINPSLDKTNLINKFIYENNDTNFNYSPSNGILTTFYATADDDPTVSDPNKTEHDHIYKGNNTYYYKTGSPLTIGQPIDDSGDEENIPVIVPKMTTQIVHVTKPITIQNNIEFEAGANDKYTNFSTIPKLIIYSEERIDITCDVMQIDAVLFAPKVTTCSDGELAKGDKASEVDYDHYKCGITNQEVLDYIRTQPNVYNVICDNSLNFDDSYDQKADNNNQKAPLKVNGAVITNKLIANRSYGASTGAASIVSAETLNFDPTLFRFEVNTGNSATVNDVNADTDLTTTYVRELPPRY